MPASGTGDNMDSGKRGLIACVNSARRAKGRACPDHAGLNPANRHMKKTYTDARARAQNGTAKAKRAEQPYYLRELPSVPFRARKTSPEFQALCERQILPLLNITGYKQDQKREAVTQAAHALVRAALADKVVADSRNTHHAGVRHRRDAWDWLIEAGFCRKCLGSEEARKVTRYQPTPKLTRLRQFWDDKVLRALPEHVDGPLLGLVRFKHRLADKGPSVEFPFEQVIRHYTQRNAHGRPDPKDLSTGIAVTRVVEEFLNQINSVNLDHSWKTTNSAGVFFQPSVELVQLHIGEMWRMTRLYTRGEIGGQNITKEARARMRIDGEPVTELDFAGSLPRLAYHLRKVNVSAKADIYASARIIPELWPLLNEEHRKTARKFIKKATLSCFMVARRASAIGAIAKQFREHPKRDKHPLSRFPTAPELVNRIALAHQAIAGDLFTGKGPKLVTSEAQIMLEILQRFVLAAKKPALAIHDALAVRRSDAEHANEVMSQTYFDRTGFRPVIEVKNPT